MLILPCPVPQLWLEMGTLQESAALDHQLCAPSTAQMANGLESSTIVQSLQVLNYCTVQVISRTYVIAQNLFQYMWEHSKHYAVMTIYTMFRIGR